ncbi:uncharacterized protein LOC143072968 [Mytilus galloprovincialis]|uniref:uncharacterized protein LOC143072968 n=1 Tax=Mytilus galloprovincialis TaxID=29158 RepID=UPI003F7B4A2C
MTEKEFATSDNVVESTGNSIDALIQASSMIQDDNIDNQTQCQTSFEEQRELDRSYIQQNEDKQSPRSTQSSSPQNLSHDTGYQNSDASFEDGRMGYDSIKMDDGENNDDFPYQYMDSSPENVLDMRTGSPTRFYKCRFCPFTASTYTQLQLHMPKHGGVKALKCSLCDYTTNDKSNFRRHRRLHMGSNPVNVLKCSKCAYTTILPRKFRDHCLQAHNDRIEPPRVHHFETSVHSPYQPPSFHQTPLQIDTLDLSAHGQPSPSNSNMTATNALHSLLSGIHPTQLSYRPQNNPTLQTQCLNQFSNYVPQVQRQTEENHMASNYLRSIVSSIMNTNMPPRVPVTSTMTSSGYFLPRTTEVHRECQSSCLSSNYQSNLPSSRQVKVKIEPRDYDEATDLHVSSSGPPYRAPKDMSHRINMQPYQQRLVETFENNSQNESSNCMDSIRTNSTDSSSSQQEVRSSADNVVNTTVKSETTTIGVQCGLHKSDSLIEISQIQPTVDCGIQCELMHHSRVVAADCPVKENTCGHCGITFDDEVLYSIHIGCHSHTDPFVCNVCGKQCSNKYGFYSHIMRGHHY